MVFAVGVWGQPYVATQSAGPVSRTNATVNGMVTPRGIGTTCWFEWGTNSSYGQFTAPTSVGSGSNVVRVSAALDNLLTNSVYRFRLVASNSAGTTYGMERRLTTGHRIATWGEAGFSPLGTIWPPQDIGEVVGIGAGDYHALAMKPDGTVVSWGAYYLSGGSLTPPQDLTNVVAVAGGRDHSLALKYDGSVVAWGLNPNGQTTVPSNLSNVVAISAGDAHSMALRADGSLVGWGVFLAPPMTIPPGLSNVVAISSGDRYCLALKNNGTVVAWGQNLSGEATVPAGLSNVVSVVAGYTHSIALRSNGTVVVWGNDPASNVPSGLSNVVQIASGDQHCVALSANGTVTSWGWPVLGGQNAPVGLTDVVNLTCGDFYSMALAANVPPSFRPTTNGGPVNQDFILNLGKTTAYDRDPNNDTLKWRIGSPPSRGALYQLESGGRGDLISTNDTPIRDSSGSVVFVPDRDEFGAPYTTFAFIANDGELDSPLATTTVNVVPAPSVNVFLATTNSVSTATIVFAGLSNASYTVWGSTNLQNWSQLGSATQQNPEQFMFADTSITNYPQRFYRIRSP